MGDEVLVKRVQNGKDQTKFGQERFKITDLNNGDAKLIGSRGQPLSRNIVGLKKAPHTPDEVNEAPQMEQGRPNRIRKTPQRFDDLVFAINMSEFSIE